MPSRRLERQLGSLRQRPARRLQTGKSAPVSSTPRPGTKIARVIELLQRDQGATPESLIVATGWLPHTARAALTGLRHRGYHVWLHRGEKGRASVYRIDASATTGS